MAKTAVITGAGSGIGAATARRFLAAGWNVALIGRREAPLKEVADGALAAMVLPCDVSDEAQINAAFDRIAGHFGRIDMLFNNAGIGAFGGTVDEIPLSVWRACVEVNLTGAFICARAAFRIMRAQNPQGGRIINNGSISAHSPRPGSAPYTATKHGITGLTKSLALDGRPFDIACGQIDIGNALTDLTAGMADGVAQADGTMHPEPTMDTAHVADAVLHMAGLPLDTNVLNMTVMAAKMPFVGRG